MRIFGGQKYVYKCQKMPLITVYDMHYLAANGHVLRPKKIKKMRQIYLETI